MLNLEEDISFKVLLRREVEDDLGGFVQFLQLVKAVLDINKLS